MNYQTDFIRALNRDETLSVKQLAKDRTRLPFHPPSMARIVWDDTMKAVIAVAEVAGKPIIEGFVKNILS